MVDVEDQALLGGCLHHHQFVGIVGPHGARRISCHTHGVDSAKRLSEGHIGLAVYRRARRGKAWLNVYDAREITADGHQSQVWEA